MDTNATSQFSFNGHNYDLVAYKKARNTLFTQKTQVNRGSINAQWINEIFYGSLLFCMILALAPFQAGLFTAITPLAFFLSWFIAHVFVTKQLIPKALLFGGMSSATLSDQQAAELGTIVQPFEQAITNYYSDHLEKFFTQRLQGDRLNDATFQEDLREFSDLVNELILLNRVFVTTTVDLKQYQSFLERYNLERGTLSTRTSDALKALRDLLGRLSQP